MLSLALLVGPGATVPKHPQTPPQTHALKHALPGLIGLADASCPLVFLDQGTDAGSREMIQAFIRRHGGALLALEGPVSAAEATALVRRQTGADYVLPFTPQDRISRAGLAALKTRLEDTEPDLAVLASAFWLTSADHPLPGPDAARGRDRAETLFADPRRLLLRGDGCDHPDPLADPAAAWTIWEGALARAAFVLHLPDPVLLRPLPETGAAPSFDAAIRWLKAAPRPERAAQLDTALLRLDDALALAPAEAAEDTLEAAQRLQAALPRALRRRLPDLPGPAARLLNALVRNARGEALAQLALLAAARNAERSRALAAEYAALRHDLDLALPGPEYLMELYSRLRGV